MRTCKLPELPRLPKIDDWKPPSAKNADQNSGYYVGLVQRRKNSEDFMGNKQGRSVSILGGFAIGILAITLPVLLLKVTDLAVYVWLPGTSLVSSLGGGGLHDRHGILFLAIGVAIDFLMYSAAAVGVLEYRRRRRKA